MAALEALSERECDLLEFEGKLESEGKATLGDERFEIAKGMVSWTKGTKKVTEIKFTPSVIEPSFGRCKCKCECKHRLGLEFLEPEGFNRCLVGSCT